MNILNQLTIKHLKMNKKRTVVTIIGIILSTALMVGIGLLFSTLRDNALNSAIHYNGNYHVKYTSVPIEKRNIIENNVEIKDYYMEQPIGYGVFEDSLNTYKPYFRLMNTDEAYLKELHLTEGRLPKDDTELVISEHILSSGGSNYKIGSKISIPLGERMVELEGEMISLTDNEYIEGEVFIPNGEVKEYTIVGVVKRAFTESYSSPGFYLFTQASKFDKEAGVTLYATLKKPNKAYKVGNNIAKSLGFAAQDCNGECEIYYDEVTFNDSVLSMYGVSRYNNFTTGMSSILAIILILVSIGCIVVIYNSFAISVMERKKQFGLFSSIGSTKKQLSHTVFFEAFLVGIIGIPIGILSAFIGIGTVLLIVNQLIGSMFDIPLNLSVYPAFLIIPVVFMIVVIILSAWFPSRRASRVTPIEAIRQNDDIKIKNKKVKTNKWVRKIFGMEGEIALKNIKRNKKKYRITIASLFISIVLFISFSSLLDYGIKGTTEYVQLPDFTYQITYRHTDSTDQSFQKVFDEIASFEQVQKSIVIMDNPYYSIDPIKGGSYSKEFEKLVSKDSRNFELQNVSMIVVDQKNYEQIKKEIGLKENKPIALNSYSIISYQDGKRKSLTGTYYKEGPKEVMVKSCNDNYDKQLDTVTSDCKNAVLSNLYFTNKIPFGFAAMINASSTLSVIVTEDQYQQILTSLGKERNTVHYTMLLEAPKYDRLAKDLKAKIDALNSDGTMRWDYYNIVEEMKLINNVVIVVEILLYGFIALVTLIGVTSVFNTINTSIALRRKEFAMLRSMGLTPHGFNKILYFESFFFGVKSLLYALPVALAITFLIYLSVGNITELQVMIPWQSILISVVGVFAIVLITMLYATSKIKKENILDAIREENI